ncbi:MAG TPA: hypothetical protein VJH20_05725 [Candidatus Nanoarchaeia archaeon]|nr:hypothetical protein [Candidatus Nanoarchaeia archaeon]
MFSKKEYLSLVISSIVLSFIFSFAEWGYEEFSASIGIRNLLLAFIISLMVLLLREYIRKIISKKIGFETEVKLWSIKKDLKLLNIKQLPIGVIISLLAIFISNGSFKFAAVSNYDLKNYSKKDLKRRYKYIRGIEEAIIASLGAIVPTLLALIFNILNVEKAVSIASIIAIYSIIPFPSQDGIKMYFGSLWYYILIMFFVIFSLVLIKSMGSIPSLILSVILSIVITSITFYQLNK